ncbi:bifunctional prephenate dehydrogenase/3-phosphoshikimate 1-carboxyvinyltransferase [Hahella sp. SMD15-11]|uniref:3-phosphoshikimate 1-carboxyvinyltransferase n=1 Tax=Thermohahella caldifontis TaxID=3142973 RepID=A0AB39UWC0_9GAMM
MGNKAPILAERLCVIGLGLIGGSFALAVRQRGLARQVVGYDLRESERRTALELGLVEAAPDTIEAAVDGADVVMLAVPVKAMEDVLRQLAPHLPPQALLTDAGSVKGEVVEAARRVFGRIPSRFVPGHPIAGSEKSGAAAANPELYARHKTILTPLPETDPLAVERIRRLWEGIGAEVIEMDVAHHDEVLAATSHVPHLIAFSLVDTLADAEDNREIFRYAAGGFRDFTRIASSDPVMWRDIFLTNRDAVLHVLDTFSQDLGQLRGAIERRDGEALIRVFTRAKAARDHFTHLLEGSAYLDTMTSQQVHFRARPAGPVRGDIRVPGDKSISHRSIMLGALAEGVTEVEGFLEGEDALATLQAFRDMGVVIEGPDKGRVRVNGVGLHGLGAPRDALYMGNSGTTMRLMTGLLSAQSFDSVLTGDSSLSRRPMERVAVPLRLMGAQVETGEGGRPPVRIYGGHRLTGIHYDLPVASAQIKSALLLAGLYAEGETSVTEPAPTRDHTERMFRGFGVEVRKDGNRIAVRSGQTLKATHIDVPSDISSAAFFIVAATITPGSDLVLRHVGSNPTRTGIISILRLMGADIEIFNEREAGGEPVADLRVRHAPLKGIRIPEELVPLAIDEFPVIFIAATQAEGETVLSGAEELRVKESDRIQAMADGLRNLGVDTEVRPDGLILHKARIRGGRVETFGDHRIAMSFAVASLVADGEIFIEDCAHVATSFPGFRELANSVGFDIGVEQ